MAVENAARHIEWLCKAFGFEVVIKVEGEGGRIEHSEIALGGGLVMLADDRADRTWRKAPKQVGGVNTQTMCIFVDDVDAHCAHARAAGATIAAEPAEQPHGDRSYRALDPEGHRWTFSTRVREMTPDEIRAAYGAQ